MPTRMCAYDLYLGHYVLSFLSEFGTQLYHGPLYNLDDSGSSWQILLRSVFGDSPLWCPWLGTMTDGLELRTLSRIVSSLEFEVGSVRGPSLWQLAGGSLSPHQTPCTM